MLLTRRDLYVFVAAMIAYLVVALIGQLLLPAFASIIAIGGGVALSMLLQLRLFRSILLHLAEAQRSQKRQRKFDNRRIDALFSLYATLGKLNHPLPPMIGWAITPDFAALLAALILEHHPSVVLETGSGVSTLIIGYCLRKTGGRLISLENNERFFTQTQHSLEAHGLQDIVTVLYTPLKPISIQGKTWQWYDISALSDLPKINFLLVDGPYGGLQKHSRYPAVPLLSQWLDTSPVIILDDYSRVEEQEIGEMWLQILKDFHAEQFDTEHGTLVLTHMAQPA